MEKIYENVHTCFHVNFLFSAYQLDPPLHYGKGSIAIAKLELFWTALMEQTGMLAYRALSQVRH